MTIAGEGMVVFDCFAHNRTSNTNIIRIGTILLIIEKLLEIANNKNIRITIIVILTTRINDNNSDKVVVVVVVVLTILIRIINSSSAVLGPSRECLRWPKPYGAASGSQGMSVCKIRHGFGAHTRTRFNGLGLV